MNWDKVRRCIQCGAGCPQDSSACVRCGSTNLGPAEPAFQRVEHPAVEPQTEQDGVIAATCDIAAGIGVIEGLLGFLAAYIVLQLVFRVISLVRFLLHKRMK